MMYIAIATACFSEPEKTSSSHQNNRIVYTTTTLPNHTLHKIDTKHTSHVQ